MDDPDDGEDTGAARELSANEDTKSAANPRMVIYPRRVDAEAGDRAVSGEGTIGNHQQAWNEALCDQPAESSSESG